MKIITIIATAALAAIVCAGCCHCRSYQKKTRRPLCGTTWQAVQLNGRDVVREEPQQYTIILSENGDMAGQGDCNRLMGHYTADESRAIRFADIASTRVMCPRGSRESEFIAALNSATHYDMDGPMLILLSNGEQRAVFQAQEVAETEQ